MISIDINGGYSGFSSFLYDWQTLITGAIAIALAAIGWWLLHSGERRDEKRLTKHLRHGIRVELEGCIEILDSIFPNSGGRARHSTPRAYRYPQIDTYFFRNNCGDLGGLTDPEISAVIKAYGQIDGFFRVMDRTGTLDFIPGDQWQKCWDACQEAVKLLEAGGGTVGNG